MNVRHSGPDSVATLRAGTVRKITQVRSEYTSARLIAENLDHRFAGTRFARHPGYLPAEIDYVTGEGAPLTVRVRDYDVRHLDRVPAAQALEHLELIHRARLGSAEARAELGTRTRDSRLKISSRFAGADPRDNEYVIPYTTPGSYSEAWISQKGAILLDLSRRGMATADFSLLASGAYLLPSAEREQCARDAIRDLEVLSGRKLDDPDNPLLVAMRSAMPEYIPGFMPTYLNVGVTPRVIEGLPRRYGRAAAARIRLNNRKTLLEALDPEAARAIESVVHPRLTLRENLEIAARCEGLIAARAPRLLESAFDQVLFFLDQAYAYYRTHLDALRNFMARETHYPAVIFQRMVCSAIDRQSYAGVLYSRHPRLGTGVFLQFGRAIFGEDLMTGRLRPEERHFRGREEARREFPAVYHFWPRLGQLEEIYRAPVMVEFTGVHGTFTVLQVNPGEMSGTGMVSAVIDMHRAGKIPEARVRELIKPYHVRQIESDAIDPKSLHDLAPFCRGLSVLPRSAVSGRLYFSLENAPKRSGGERGANVVLAKERFTPTDAVELQRVSGICSLSPAAIHVVTAAQNLGIPALLNLEESGTRLDRGRRLLVNRDGRTLAEGDWVTISSRMRTLFVGKAVYAPARLLRFMAGEKIELTLAERERFAALADTYREYRRILESVDASQFESLQDIGHSIRYGRLQRDPQCPVYVNRSFDLNRPKIVVRLLDSTLGMHLIAISAFELLTPDRRARLLKDAAALLLEKEISGYQAGAFVIGSLVKPGSPAAFWEGFAPAEIAVLINEWVLHQKYLDLIEELEERKISEAKDQILTGGLGRIRVHPGFVAEFTPLKLSRVDLGEVRAALPSWSDPQTREVLDVLRRPDDV
jgi:pyruvate,orthophosphate dikinase